MKQSEPPLHYTRADLARIAAQAMVARGLAAEFSESVLQQMALLTRPGVEAGGDIRDLRHLLWCSIDNDDSRDLDQLSVCELREDGTVKILVAIADVDSLVKKDSPLDVHARRNTTSVYTAAHIFSMLPERLSTDLTSLNAQQDRLAVVTELVFSVDARLIASNIYRACVHNCAKLAYDSVARWLEGKGALPQAAQAVPGMDVQLRAQDAIAQKLRVARHAMGALEFVSIQSKTIFSGEDVVDVKPQQANRARQLIEELMLMTNGVTARYLSGKGYSALCRVVRSPERWEKIIEVARDFGDMLPKIPDPKALEGFLRKRQQADPLRFPDLSLVIIKLMGAGEYALQKSGEPAVGHFGLAVREYSHSTAPNRRFADLLTQRMVKAALIDAPAPYTDEQLEVLARQCNEQGSAANKVERQVRKSEAALVLQPRIGHHFEGIITSVSSKGVWLRVFSPPVDGRLVAGEAGMRIGQKLTAKLLLVDVERGFIDFERVME